MNAKKRNYRGNVRGDPHHIKLVTDSGAELDIATQGAITIRGLHRTVYLTLHISITNNKFRTTELERTKKYSNTTYRNYSLGMHVESGGVNDVGRETWVLVLCLGYLIDCATTVHSSERRYLEC